MTGGWHVEHRRGRAAELHALELPDPLVPTVWAFELAAPAVVLGSTQPDEVVDRSAAARSGLDVARRRSGGGAVLLVPDETTWIDVLLPPGHPRWSDDVGRASWWLGRAWADALGDLGVDGAEVHRGPLERSSLTSLVCFAGMGPGEVRLGPAKVVGISQRRSRVGARFQCLLLHRWDPLRLLDVLAVDGGPRAEALRSLPSAATGIGRDIGPSTVLGALVARLEEAAAGPR